MKPYSWFSCKTDIFKFSPFYKIQAKFNKNIFSGTRLTLFLRMGKWSSSTHLQLGAMKDAQNIFSEKCSL